MTTPLGQMIRRLTPEQDIAIKETLDKGGSVPILATAYGVNVRTIYRAAMRAGEPTRVVSIAGWAATFRLTDEGPIQTTPWHPTQEALDAWPD